MATASPWTPTLRKIWGVDSLDIVELSMALEEEFDIGEMSEEDLATIKTVGDLVNYLQGKLDL